MLSSWKDCDWERIKEWLELLRLTAKITGTKGCLSSRKFGRETIMRYADERDGLDKTITLETMDDRFFQWLDLKGIKYNNEHRPRHQG